MIYIPSSLELSYCLSDEENYKMMKNLYFSAFNVDYSQRKKPATLSIDGETIQMTLGKVYLNFLLLAPYVKFKIKVTKDDLFLDKNVTQDNLNRYFNHCIQTIRKGNSNIDYDDIRQAITDVMDELCDLSGDYNVAVGNSVSYRDLIKLEVEDPEADALFHPDVKPGAFNEVEQQFKEEGKKLIKYFESHPETELHPFVTSKTGINLKQFTQAVG